jgi:hypothetical protein
VIVSLGVLSDLLPISIYLFTNIFCLQFKIVGGYLLPLLYLGRTIKLSVNFDFRSATLSDFQLCNGRLPGRGRRIKESWINDGQNTVSMGILALDRATR